MKGNFLCENTKKRQDVTMLGAFLNSVQHGDQENQQCRIFGQQLNATGLKASVCGEYLQGCKPSAPPAVGLLPCHPLLPFLPGLGAGDGHHSRAQPRGHGVSLYHPSDGAQCPALNTGFGIVRSIPSALASNVPGLWHVGAGWVRGGGGISLPID